MLEEQDIKQIGDTIKKELKTFNDEILMPAFGQYTEEVMLPAVGRQMKDHFGEFRDDVTNVIDKRVLRAQDEITKAIGKQVKDSKEELVKVVKTEHERHKLFYLKVLSIFERSKMAQPEEVAAMRELVM